MVTVISREHAKDKAMVIAKEQQDFHAMYVQVEGIASTSSMISVTRLNSA